MRVTFRLLTTCLILLAACSSGDDPAIGGGEAAGSGASVASESTNGRTALGTSITLIAEGLTFDRASLSVPAGESFALTLDNRDEGQQHNFSVYADDTARDKLFGGDLFQGIETRTFDVAPLEAGSYFFRCDVHPDEMTGVLTAT